MPKKSSAQDAAPVTGSTNINASLKLVMKSGKYKLGYRETLRSLRSGRLLLVQHSDASKENVDPDLLKHQATLLPRLGWRWKTLVATASN